MIGRFLIPGCCGYTFALLVHGVDHGWRLYVGLLTVGVLAFFALAWTASGRP